MSLEADGIRGTSKVYGVRNTDMRYGGFTDGDSLIKTIVWDFNYDGLPDAGATKHEYVVPAGSTIVSCHLRIVTAFTSTSTTTDLDVGFQRSNGTEIDNNGLITAAEATQTAIAVVGSYIAGAGALIGKISDATYNAELVVTPTVADLLTGRGQVILQYIPPAP
jgi:hypothetical protein